MNIDTLKQANEIYQKLADKTVNEALAALNTFENTDVEVLRLVKSLINNSQHSSTIFDAQLGKPYQFAMENQWQAGDEIEGYLLCEMIGQGGMSVVFKAQRISKATQKPVAIKLFNLPQDNSTLKDQFLKEQNILTKLSHRNVIDFHHGQSTAQGVSYIVMELLDQGLPINEYVEKTKASMQDVVSLLIQACEGLHYAHKHLVVHLDVKPSNLLVDHNGQLKVLDFGIAKMINAKINDQNDDKTKNELIALTPTFAAPEQINSTGFDTSSDVYSLAAVAVNLLTGKQPFPSQRLLNDCSDDESHVSQLLDDHLGDKELRHVLLKAMRTDRQSRYEDMHAFRQDLKAWQQKKPVTATKNTWWYRVNRFVVRRTALFVTSMLLLITLLSGVTLLVFQNQAIQKEADKANAVKQFMLDAFSVTDPNTAQGVDVSAKDLLRSASAKIDANTDLDAIIKFELKLAMAAANGSLGFYPESISLLRTALDLQPKHEMATGMLTEYLLAAGEIENLNQLLEEIDEGTFVASEPRVKVMRTRAVVAAEAGHYNDAFAIQEEMTTFELSDRDYILSQALLAEIYFLQGDSERAVAVIETVKETHPLVKNDVLNISLNSDLVQFHDRNGNYKAAMALTKENIAIYHSILGDNHPELGMAYNALSAFQWLDGQLDDALKSAANSEAIFRKRFGDLSEGLAQSLSNTGLAYYYQQKYDSAIKHLTQSTDMLSEIFGPEHPETMNAKANLATILNAVGYPEKALPILIDMYAVESKTLGKSHRSTLYTQQSLALALAKSGQFDTAIEHAQENHRLVKKHFADRNLMTNHTNSILGRVYYMSGDFKSAIDYNLKYIAQWTEGNENNLAQSYYLIAKSHHALGNLDEAFEHFSLWTEKLKILYQETDKKYLEGQLTVAEFAQKTGRHELKNMLISEVKSIIKTHLLDLPDTAKKLKELSPL